MAEVRRVKRNEWEQIKAIRLEMLEDTPEAYITTLPEAVGFDDSVWIERAEKGSTGTSQATMLGFDGGIPVAMAVGLRKTQGRRDVLVLVSVYVSPGHRGTSLATDLIAETESWGIGWQAPLATLWVAEENPRARAFYHRIGYRPTGDRIRMKPGSNRMEMRLEKRFKR